MKKRLFGAALSAFLLLFLLVGTAASLNAEDMIRLKKAGIEGETIQTIIDEKAVETCAFTVDQIIDLKKAGLKGKTLRGIIRKGSFMKDTAPVVYGTETKSIRHMSPQDIIELKRAGVSDDVITSIVKGTLDRDNEDHRRAWSMLENMGLIVDRRGPIAPPIPPR